MAAMGADYIGFRGCDLQRSLGVDGFLGKLKLRAYKGAIEAQVPEAQRATVQVQVQVTGRAPQTLSYGGICQELDSFARGSAECPSCPVGGGAPVGCYRYVGYPVDAITEEVAFSFFCGGLDTPDSIADQLYRDIVSRVPLGSGWHTQRPGPLAELPAPFVYTSPGGRRVDSAQLLAAMFITLEHPALVVAYARFFHELLAFVAAERDRVATLEADGQIRLKVDVARAEDAGAATMRVLERAKALYGSRTLRELGDVADLINQTIPYALQGAGYVHVDG